MRDEDELSDFGSLEFQLDDDGRVQNISTYTRTLPKALVQPSAKEVRYPNELQVRGRLALFAKLLSDTSLGIGRKLSLLQQEFPEITQPDFDAELFRRQQDRSSLSDDYPCLVEDMLSEPDKNRRYLTEIGKLVSKPFRELWLLGALQRLACRWRPSDLGPHEVDRLLQRVFFDPHVHPRGMSESAFEPYVPIYPYTTLEDVIRKVKIQYKRQVRDKRRRREPDNFDLYVNWLYRHLIGHSADSIERLFEDSKHYSSSYIALMVQRTARIVGIKLRRGPPPKGGKR